MTLDWIRASVIIDRFERMATMNVRDLRGHYQRIVSSETKGDQAVAAQEKHCAKRLIDQLVAGLQQILALRAQIVPEDQDRFDIRIEPIRLQIQSVVNSLDAVLKEAPPKPIESPSGVTDYERLYENELNQHATHGVQTQKQVKMDQLRLEMEQRKADAEAHQSLQRDITDLNYIMEDLARLVHQQHDMVDSIEEHVEKSHQHVQQGHQQLKKAVAAKSAKYPLIAAAVGSVALGGPIGVAAGSAVAGVFAAVGGAVAGLYGGRAIKRHHLNEANSPAPSS
uniref:t-SNARE coiled-coil homology domain-containing protein n=1 Tax=Steinernema glaseri TaxID=37863 RepID=A0A1I8AQH4_9BILA